MDGDFSSKLDEIYPVGIESENNCYYPEKLWEVTDKELALAKSLCDELPIVGNELIN